MLNVIIFFVTVALGLVFSAYKWGNTHKLGWIRRAGALGALFVPLNIDGGTVTVAGNGVSDGHFFSVISIYQKAEGEAFALVSPLAFQKAKEQATVVLGLAGYQQSERTVLVTGIAFWQKAEKEATVLLGLGGYQRALKARTPVGIVLLQRSGKHERAFGAFSTFSPD